MCVELCVVPADKSWPRQDTFCWGNEVFLMCRNAKCCWYADAAGATTEQRRRTDVANSVIEWFRADTVSSQLTVKRRPTFQRCWYDVVASSYEGQWLSVAFVSFGTFRYVGFCRMHSHLLVPPPKEGGYVFTRVCLSVFCLTACLSDSPLDYSKSYEWIFMKFFGG